MLKMPMFRRFVRLPLLVTLLTVVPFPDPPSPWKMTPELPPDAQNLEPSVLATLRMLEPENDVRVVLVSIVVASAAMRPITRL